MKVFKTGLPAIAIIWIFYVISYCDLLEILNSYTNTDYQSVATGTKPLLKWIPDGLPVNDWLSFLFPSLMILITIALPFVYLRAIRVFFFLILFLIHGFRFQYVNGHSGHFYVWASLFFCFVSGDLRDRSHDDEELKAFIRVAQIQIFVIYGLAGVWKALSVFRSFIHDNIAAGMDFVPYAMASEFLYSNKQTAAPSWIVEQPLLCLLLSLLVLVAQTGSLVAVFFPRIYFFWGLLLASFHVGTLLTVNVFFRWSVPPIVLFLCLYPLADRGHLKLLGALGWGPKEGGSDV